MNCTSCGANLPARTVNCPVCGIPTPYNVSPPAGSYDPTVAASPYGMPPTPPMPPTGYGTPSYGTPQDPYSNPSTNPYSGPTSYAPPPPPSVQPIQPQPYGPGQFGPSMQTPPSKPKSKLPLILGIIGGVLLLLCVGACALFYVIGKNTPTTTTTSTTTLNATATVNGTTPTPASATPVATGPSGNTIVPSAAAIITGAQSATGIDKNYYPTGTSTTFKVNQSVYITFNLKLPQTGYVQSKWYVDNVFGAGKILSLDKIDFTHAYFVNTYKIAATGTVELYWCTKSDCSDAQLASVVTFTVGSSAHIQSPVSTTSIASMVGRDRRA